MYYCPYSDSISPSAVIRIFVLYPFVSWLVGVVVVIYVLLGCIVDYCDVTICDNKSTRIACMFRRARDVWWASSNRFYAEFGGNR